MLWQRTLHNVSLICAVLVLLLTESPNLHLDHVECRFDVISLVRVVHEPLLSERVVVTHLFPERAMSFLVALVIRDAIRSVKG